MGILKIGVVGYGRIGKLHINNLINSVPGVQVVAAADPMLDKVRRTREAGRAQDHGRFPPTLWTLSTILG